MPQHPALAPGRVAVVTGAASGIGLAAAQRFAALGMRVCHGRRGTPKRWTRAVAAVAERGGRAGRAD